MPRSSKGNYSPKQKRQAEHIEETKDAERIAWATLNKQDQGAKGAKTKKNKECHE